MKSAESMDVGTARTCCEYFGQRLVQYKRKFGSSDYKPTLDGARASLSSDEVLLSLHQVQEGVKSIIEMMQSPDFGWGQMSRIFVSSSIFRKVLVSKP